MKAAQKKGSVKGQGPMPHRSLVSTQVELFESLARLQCERPLQIRSLIFGSEHPIEEFAAELAPFRLRVSARRDYFVGTFDYTTGQHRLAGEVFFCPTSLKHISQLIIVCDGTVWDRAIMRLARSLYPSLVPLFLSQKEMVSLLQGAKSIFPDCRLRITGHARKKRLKGGTRRHFEASRTKTEKPPEVVFREAEEQNFWFESVVFDYVSEAQEVSDSERRQSFPTVTLSKYGHVFTTSAFERVYYGLHRPLTEIAASKMAFFRNRARRFIPGFGARPIAIRFDSAAFESPEDNKMFIGLLRRMPGAGCTVVHGNPYVHLTIRDDKDGSGTEIWVLDENEITLVPQIKSSEGALKRLVNYIFEEWREGQLVSVD